MHPTAIGTAPNMSAELFNMMAGTKLVHVPYHSNFMPDMLSGQVQLAFLPVPLIIGFIRGGKVRAHRRERRHALGCAARRATDRAIRAGLPSRHLARHRGAERNTGGIADKLHNDINAVLNDPAMKPKFETLGADPAPMTTAELDKFIAAEVDKWAKVIKFADIKAS